MAYSTYYFRNNGVGLSKFIFHFWCVGSVGQVEARIGVVLSGILYMKQLREKERTIWAFKQSWSKILHNICKREIVFMYSIIIRILQSEMVFQVPSKIDIAQLESFFEILDYQEEANGIIIHAKNLKLRRSELINELEKIPEARTTA